MCDTGTQHLEMLRTYWKRNDAFLSMVKLCEVVGLTSAAIVFDLVGHSRAKGFVFGIKKPRGNGALESN